MKRRCDVEGCDREATVHDTIIRKGEVVERHLCHEHAKHEKIVTMTHASIGDLLTKFVVSQGAPGKEARGEGLACAQCGLTFSEFRKKGLLGCPACYEAFAEPLGPLLERAREGATHHLGKVPKRAGRDVDRQARIAVLRRQLEQAIEAEQYEKAATLRDSLKSVEAGNANGSGEGAS